MKSFVFSCLLMMTHIPGASQARTGRARNGSQKVIFPLHTSSNKRYLADEKDKPFPILGRTSWCIISLPKKSYRQFIQHSLSYGYDAIEMNAINHDPRGNRVPFNGNGELPFLRTLGGADWKGSLAYNNISVECPDFTAPNTEYWNFVDSFLKYCESNGILVFFFPAYVGYENTNQGWMQEMTANGPAKMEAYGRWIATRLQERKNIVWMLLGDMGTFNEAQAAVEAALIRGLKSVPLQQSGHYSAEANSGQNSTDQVDFGKEMNLNGTYTWDSTGIASLGRRAYANNPVMPAFLLEEPYDEEGPDGNGVNPHATQPVRRFQWTGWLSTIGGYIAGNGYIWPFVDPFWTEHLNSAGAKEMAVLNAFIRSIPWWELVPSGLNGMRTLIISDETKIDADKIVAAANPDGTLLVAYRSPDQDGGMMVDVTGMSDQLDAKWFDPTNGTYSPIGGSPFVNTGRISIAAPPANGQGARDLVLVIRPVK